MLLAPALPILAIPERYRLLRAGCFEYLYNTSCDVSCSVDTVRPDPTLAMSSMRIKPRRYTQQRVKSIVPIAAALHPETSHQPAASCPAASSIRARYTRALHHPGGHPNNISIHCFAQAYANSLASSLYSTVGPGTRGQTNQLRKLNLTKQ